MNRKIYYWKLRQSEMQLGERTLIMGVLNLTPDSFSDGGRFNDPDRAYARALELEEAGADIIDIGAESTRPGSQRISADEEWQRLVPVLKRLNGNLKAPLSLDTYKSEIAERALQYGVEIFNDPSGLTYDPGLAKVAANGNAGLILNHMRGTPETWAKLPPMQDPLGSIGRDLDATINRARGAGVDRSRIMIDPGLGFGKRKEQNAEIIAHLRELAALDYPILVGASRKSFLAQSTEADTAFATAAAVTAAILNGAHIVRVHDVKAMQSVVLVADEIAHAAGIQSRPAAEERPAIRASKSGPIEPERIQPTRPPLAKPVVVPLPPPPEVVAQPVAEASPKAPEKKKQQQERPRSNPPFKFSADREAARGSGGFNPPVRRPSFGSDRDRPQAGRFERSGPPRDRPQGDRSHADRPHGDRPKRDFRPGGERPSKEGPGSGPPRRDFRPGGSRPPFGGPPRGDSSRPRFAGPPRGEGPGSGPPRRDFRPGGSRPPSSGPPRGGDRPDRSGPPAKRPFRKRP
jgi:dihydropteroate synthase